MQKIKHIIRKCMSLVIAVQIVFITLFLYVIFGDFQQVQMHKLFDSTQRQVDIMKERCEVEKELMKTNRDWECWARGQ